MRFISNSVILILDNIKHNFYNLLMKRKNNVNRIIVNLKQMSDFYSSFSDNENRIINANIIDYVEESVQELDNKDPIEFEINIQKKSSTVDISTAKRTYHNYYKKEIKQDNHNMQRLGILAVIFFLIGCTLAVLIHQLSLIDTPYIVMTLLEITMWVFVTEFVDTACLKMSAEVISRNRHIRLMNAEFIVFLDEEINNEHYEEKYFS